MKLISKLQSYTDVITNSSSTVFLMREFDANYWRDTIPDACCDIDYIDEDWLMKHPWEWELVFDYLNIDKNTISTEIKGSYWETVEIETWEEWLKTNKDLINKELVGLYFVEIHDHFENAYETIESASDDSLLTDWRH